MTITIKLRTGNAAFNEDDPVQGSSPAARDAEIGRILRNWLRDENFYPTTTPLRDVNGNTVGSVTVTGK
jgi:hypothetical protein